MNPLLLGGAIGASAMYFLDPQCGRRRRARTRDQLTHARRRLSEAGSVTGALGHAVAALFGADPKSEMDADLLRMKTLLETGKPPHDAARRTA